MRSPKAYTRGRPIEVDEAAASRSARKSAEERVPHRQRWEPAEFAVGGLELGDAVRKAHRGDSGVVNHRPDDLPGG